MNPRRLSWLRSPVATITSVLVAWNHPLFCGCPPCSDRAARQFRRRARNSPRRPDGNPPSGKEITGWLLFVANWDQTADEPPAARKRTGGTP